MGDLDFGPVNDPTAYGFDAGAGINWSGFGDTLVDLAKVYGGVELAKNRQSPMYSVGPNGQVYRQGAPAPQYGQTGGMSPLLILLLIGGLVLAVKD